MKDLLTKEERWKKFYEEHPEYTKDSLKEIKRQKLKEIKKAERIKALEKLFELRFTNKLTIKQLAKRFGITKQAVSDKIIKGKEWLAKNVDK